MKSPEWMPYRRVGPPEPLDQLNQPLQPVKNKALQTPWGPKAEQCSHHKAQITPRHMTQQAFENPSMGLQMRPTHPAGLIAVSERAFQQFAPLP